MINQPLTYQLTLRTFGLCNIYYRSNRKDYGDTITILVKHYNNKRIIEVLDNLEFFGDDYRAINKFVVKEFNKFKKQIRDGFTNITIENSTILFKFIEINNNYDLIIE